MNPRMARFTSPRVSLGPSSSSADIRSDSQENRAGSGGNGDGKTDKDTADAASWGGGRSFVRRLETASLVDQIERRFAAQISTQIVAEEFVDLARSML